MLSERNMNKEIIFNLLKEIPCKSLYQPASSLPQFSTVPLFSAESVYVGLDQVAIRTRLIARLKKSVP